MSGEAPASQPPVSSSTTDNNSNSEKSPGTDDDNGNVNLPSPPAPPPLLPSWPPPPLPSPNSQSPPNYWNSSPPLPQPQLPPPPPSPSQPSATPPSSSSSDSGIVLGGTSPPPPPPPPPSPPPPTTPTPTPPPTSSFTPPSPPPSPSPSPSPSTIPNEPPPPLSALFVPPPPPPPSYPPPPFSPPDHPSSPLLIPPPPPPPPPSVTAAGSPSSLPLSPPPPNKVALKSSPPTSDSSTNLDVSSSSHPSSHDHSSPSNSNNTTVVIGAIAGGAVAFAIAALIAVVVFLVLKKKKKKKKKGSTADHDLSGQSKSRTLFSKQAADNMFYAPKQPAAPSSAPINSYGSHGGVVPGYHPRPVLPDSGGSKLWFSYEELRDFTNGFSQENLLGEGGFGCVYKGYLPDGRTVAVKQLKVGGSQGEREFRAEVEIISRVHHRHLVSLVGFCVDEHQRLLVYDYLPNKTLEYHLHGNGLPVLEWSKRRKIAIGSARGLGYLHEDCHPRIIHRDIKSANILLDNCFEAQVSDFGLAKLSNDTHSHVSTRVVGTFGYMAPEYASSGKLTDRSDVFSFGVVLLEIITGRKPVDPSQPLGDESLVEWARPLLVRALETGDYEEFVDPRLEKNYVKSEMISMIEVAAACVRHSAPKRPRMAQVLRQLDNGGDLSDLSNGMKFGQSTLFNSAQYSAEVRRFHRSGTDSDEFGSNNDSSSREHSRRLAFSGDFSNREVSP